MEIKLNTEITVRDIFDGFTYNTEESKGLFGLSGKLTIQAEYQRNNIYADEKLDIAVIQSLLKGYPLGLIYFYKTDNDRFEILDGEQRIISIGRFIKNNFSICYTNGIDHFFDNLSEDDKKKILESKLLIYECMGEESEIKELVKTIKMAGIPMNEQKLLNTIYSGPFISLAKAKFSNSQNSDLIKWNCFINGNTYQQDFLTSALNWVSKGNISNYIQKHRNDNNIKELENYFENVINWASSVFKTIKDEMYELEWGSLYEKYKENTYDKNKLDIQVKELYANPSVKSKKGIFEYLLGGSKEQSLLS